MKEVDRLRAARTLFERAQRDNVTMQEARGRIHAERYAVIADKLGWVGAVGLCGTAAPAAEEGPAAPPQFWWDRL